MVISKRNEETYCFASVVQTEEQDFGILVQQTYCSNEHIKRRNPA
jgi:hypothetical protein